MFSARRSARGVVEGGPVAGLDEVGPVEGMKAGIACQHVELYETQRVAATFSELEMLVVAPHLPPGPGVAHGPQAHEQRFGAGEHERASQTVHAVAVAHFADTGVAGRQRYQLRPPQVQPRRFERRQDTIVLVGSAADICVRERQPSPQQRIPARTTVARRCAGFRREAGILQKEPVRRNVQEARCGKLPQRRFGGAFAASRVASGNSRRIAWASRAVPAIGAK